MENRARFSRWSLSITMLACVLLLSGCETEEQMSPAFEAVHDNDINRPPQLAEETEEDDPDSAAVLQGLLVIGGAVAIGSATPDGSFSGDEPPALVKGLVEDMTAEQDRVRPQQGVAGGGRPPAGTPRPTVLALAKPVPVPTDESWKMCGVGKKCLIGNLYPEACSAPYGSKPMCTDGCISDSGTFYHDTTLPSNRAYVGGGSKCPRGSCNIVNSCD